MNAPKRSDDKRRRHQLILILIAFIASRVLQVWLAERPINQNAAYGDLEKYEGWSSAMVNDRLTPYSEVEIEYPPGVLPFLAAAEVGRHDDTAYRHRFIAVMALVDIAGFTGILLLGRRWRSMWGPWVWALGPVLLGPIVYLRLDLIPAVATIWTVERAAAGGWAGAGAFLGFGALSKIYPGFLFPPALLASSRPKKFLAGAAAAGIVALAPFVRLVPDLYQSVARYHFGRGIHVESTWGTALLFASKLGRREVSVNFQFGANEVISTLAPSLKLAGLALSLLAWAGATWLIASKVAQDDIAGLAAGMFGLLAVLMGLGTVYSPQFTIWLIALAAAALCAPVTRQTKMALASVLAVAMLTRAVFPHTIDDVLNPFYTGGPRPGSLMGLGLLAARNLLVLAAGALALRNLGDSPKSGSRAISSS